VDVDREEDFSLQQEFHRERQPCHYSNLNPQGMGKSAGVSMVKHINKGDFQFSKSIDKGK
jgi:hypothetical protein